MITGVQQSLMAESQSTPPVPVHCKSEHLAAHGCADLLDGGISDTDNTKSIAGEIGKKRKGLTHLPRQQARQLPVRHPDRQWLPEAS